MARGFSIIEVMVSSAMFLITATAVVSGASTATNAYEHQRRVTEGLALAEYHLEELLLRYAAHTDLSPGVTHSRCAGDLNDDASCRYTLEWTVQPAPGASGLRQIDLNIRWTETGARPQRVALVTYRP